MNNNSIRLLSNLNRVQSNQQYADTSFPDSQQVQAYQQVAHELRSIAFGEFGRSMVNFFKSLWTGFKNRRAHRKVLAELDQLDSFMLKDIGLARSDVEALRYGATTVERLNERRSSSAFDRQRTNKLQVCQCNEKLSREIISEPLRLAKCG